MKHYVTVLLISLLLSSCTSQTPTAQSLEVPPDGSFYHGVYPGGKTGEEDDITANDVASYQDSVGRKVAWVYFSNNWFHGEVFPIETASWIRQGGAIPFIRLMLRSSADTDIAEENYTLEAIVAGTFDRKLKAWGNSARAFGTPLIVEWGTEMNGQWFSWNGYWNGKQDGPKLFRDAYRHIVQTIDAENITWVFHINSDDDPQTTWNAFENYYPGDDVVDWLGVSAYSAQSPQDDYWTNFVEQLDLVMPRLNNLSSKPVMVLEFGATHNNSLGKSDQWADQALSAILSKRWPSIRGFSWWNETWQNDDNPANDTDMRVQTNNLLAEVFRKHLKSDEVVDRPITK
jgi:Glycosyl hydrolase family 26